MLKTQAGSVNKTNGYEMVNVESEDANNINKFSPLLQAAQNGDLEGLKACLEQGDDILQCGEGRGRSTALHYVAYGVDLQTALSCAGLLILHAKNANLNLLSNLLNAENIFKGTALGNAALRGNAELMELLLEEGARLTVTNSNESVFHVLAKLENHENAIACAEIALNLKYYNNDPKELLNYLNIEDRFTNRTALHMTGVVGNYKLIQKLIVNGADPKKVDCANCNIFHLAVGNAFKERAIDCTQTLMEEIIPGWVDIRKTLLESFDNAGRCPVHIAARRGFNLILGQMSDYYLVVEGGTGFTPLHAAASLGNANHAELCVKEILDNVDTQHKSELCNAQDAEGCTPLFLSAKEKNVEACKLLLLSGSGFDIKNKEGKTPLEKVYKKIPQAVSVLLDEAVKNSGYVAYFRTINSVADLDFGPILGYSTSKSNVYKETEELAKICEAKFVHRKTVLYHPFIQIYIHEKWEKVKWFFHIFRFLHILWFFLNCLFVVWAYRYVCPVPGAKHFTWVGLRPGEDDEKQVSNKTLSECAIPAGLCWSGYMNLLALLMYLLCQCHETKQKFHQIFHPMKSNEKRSLVFRTIVPIGYYIYLFLSILPLGPLLIGTGILVTILPTIGLLPFQDFVHYFIAGIVGLAVWIAICLEAMKIPKFSFYKNLLWRSARTLLVAITVTAPILFGFAALFTILIPGERAFSSPAQSLVKVITFMIGELDYGSLVYGETESIFLGWVMLFMALFVVIIVVLLVNFLIGLAAEEISDVWDRAVVWSLCTKLEQIFALESFLDEQIPLCGRGFLRRNLMLMPPQTEKGQVVKQMRRARIQLQNLPKELQKEFHQLNLDTISEVK